MGAAWVKVQVCQHRARASTANPTPGPPARMTALGGVDGHPRNSRPHPAPQSDGGSGSVITRSRLVVPGIPIGNPITVTTTSPSLAIPLSRASSDPA